MKQALTNPWISSCRGSLVAILILCSHSVLPISALERIRGHLVIIGGGEVPQSVLKEFVHLAGGTDNARIMVIPNASAEPDVSGKTQAETFRAIGAQDVRVLLVRREEADRQEILSALDRATGIYFTGGDQSRLATNLVGTAVQQKLLQLYQSGGVIGGTSAGAAIMSKVMITGEQRLHPDAKDGFTTIEHGNVVTREGLGFITSAIIDQHFVARKRQNRLISLLLENPALLGVGIDERTAVIVRPDGKFDVIGEGTVMILDARAATNVRVAANGNLAGRNVITHLLTSGDQFDPAK